MRLRARGKTLPGKADFVWETRFVCRCGFCFIDEKIRRLRCYAFILCRIFEPQGDMFVNRTCSMEVELRQM